ncbi:Serine/threonine-protein kinase [Hordeum vulgare]|nr:Serine/threonine-protein kinase [Hordeum vulgare]
MAVDDGVVATVVTSRIRVAVAERVMAMVAESGVAATMASSRLWEVVAERREDEKVAVAQLCIRDDILVYHYHLATRPCERFAKFINSPIYSFATMDTSNDLETRDVSGFTSENLVNIHDHYKVWATPCYCNKRPSNGARNRSVA